MGNRDQSGARQMGRGPATSHGFEGIVADAGFEMIPITLIEVRQPGLIVADHRDSFDRLLASQAIENDLLVLTVDEAFKSLGCAIAG